MRVKNKLSCFWWCVLAFSTPFPAKALLNGNRLVGHADLVRLVFQDGSMCSGAFIDPYTVLTAAHCLIPQAGESMHRLDKIIGLNDQILNLKQLGNLVHPDYEHQFWPTHDLGLIKTSFNAQFQHDFVFEPSVPVRVGQANLYGCGVIQFAPKVRARSVGTNWYLRIASVIFLIGGSRTDPAHRGTWTSLAPNDSGGPVTLADSRQLIAVGAQSTASADGYWFLPAISLGTVIADEENFKFITIHLGEAHLP